MLSEDCGTQATGPPRPIHRWPNGRVKCARTHKCWKHICFSNFVANGEVSLEEPIPERWETGAGVLPSVRLRMYPPLQGAEGPIGPDAPKVAYDPEPTKWVRVDRQPDKKSAKPKSVYLSVCVCACAHDNLKTQRAGGWNTVYGFYTEIVVLYEFSDKIRQPEGLSICLRVSLCVRLWTPQLQNTTS